MTDLLRCALPATPDPELAGALARPRVRGAVLQALAAARERPAYAAPVLARFFREARWLHSRERSSATELVYGMFRHEALLTRAGGQDDEARLALLATVLEGDRLEQVASRGQVEDYAAALSLPEPVAAEWLDVLGDEEAAALGAALASRAPVTVRANRARCTRDELAARLEQEGVSTQICADAPDALDLLRRVNVVELASFRDGLFEVQDASSQRFVEAVLGAAAQVGLAPAEPTLDLCAGAGGKSLALAARGLRVRATDLRGDALDRLRTRARRAGARIDLGPPLPCRLVVVDAPCSGIGRLRRDPALRWGLELSRHPPLQRRLLDEATRFVQPGGLLAYATCSLMRAENEQDLPWELVDERLLWPHRGGTDGFGWRIWHRV